VLERTVRDHPNAIPGQPERGPEPLGAVLGVDHHGVHRVRDAPEGGGVAAPRLPRQYVVRREYPRTGARQHPRGQLLQAEPLVVDHVRGVRAPARVGHVERRPRHLDRPAEAAPCRAANSSTGR
jgi:hypothetical protein